MTKLMSDVHLKEAEIERLREEWLRAEAKEWNTKYDSLNLWSGDNSAAIAAVGVCLVIIAIIAVYFLAHLP